MMLLGDDGTLDTVIVCSECGAEMRYNFDGSDGEEYADFVEWAKDDAADDHECEGKEG
jgi:hypothetical protein